MVPEGLYGCLKLVGSYAQCGKASCNGGAYPMPDGFFVELEAQAR
jgi:hypothetical protein